MGIANHYFFRTVTFDYGNYNFAFYDYSHFRISSMPTYSGKFIQDHFSFTLMYFIPVYWLLNWLTGTYTLIIIQYSCVAIAAWFTLKLISLKTDNHLLTAGAMIYYFTLHGRFTSFSCDVNIAVIASCFIPVVVYFFQVEKYKTALVVLLLALFSRENIPLWFIFVFIVLITENHKNRRAVIYSTLGILISVIYFIILFKILIPSVEDHEKQFTLFNYSALGENPGEALSFAIKNPLRTIELFFVNHIDNPAYDGVKGEFYIVYLISGGFILLLRPQYIIWFIPVIAQKMFNDSFIRWGISTYYSIEVVTLLPLSVFLIISTLKNKLLQNILAIIVCFATVITTIYKLEPQNCLLPWSLNPAKEKIWNKAFFTAPFDILKVNNILKMIPDSAGVSASDHLFPHLSQRKYVALFPEIKDADYIVFSVFDNNFMLSHQENEDQRFKIISDSSWQVVGREFPVFLFWRNSDSDIYQDSKSLQVLKSDTIFCSFENTDTVNNLVRSRDNRIVEKVSLLTNEMAFSEKKSVKLTPENPFSSVYKLENIKTGCRVKISAWSYSTEEFNANIIAGCGDNFKFNSNEADTVAESGWKRLTLNFWVPNDSSECGFSFWNNGTQPACFDDLQVVINFYN